MALSRIGYFGLNTHLFSLNLRKSIYQKSIIFLSTSVSSHSDTQPNKPSHGMFKRYENFIEKKFPRYYLVHRQIVDGCKWCISDLKTYFSLKRGLKSNELTIENFNKNELECYIQFPSEFVKMITVLVLVQFPIIGEFIIFMSQVLTRHFWRQSKYKEFRSIILASKSQSHFESLLSNLKLKEGLSLPIQISEIKNSNIIVPKFEEMDRSQLYHLLRLYQISPFNGITKLKERSFLIHCLDNKLRNENNNIINTMDEHEIITQLYIRRIMFTNEEDINILRKRLQEWVKYSGQFYEHGNESLLLYVPVLTQGIKK